MPNQFTGQPILSSLIPPERRKSLERRKALAERRGQNFKIQQPRMLEPRGLERQYQVELRRYFAELFNIINERLVDRLEPSFKEYQREVGRSDDLADDVAIFFAGVKIQFAEKVSEGILRNMIRNMGLAVSGFNLQQFRKVFKKSLAVDPFASEPWLESRVNAFVETNVGLIKSVEDKFFGEMQEIVFRGARQGLQTQEISRMIRERTKVARSRADLIARDQINKLNGQMNQIRQESIGVKSYRWRTSLDERVRPEHRAREGKVYPWDQPPSDGHPGEPIRCRCYAEPVLEDAIEEES